MYHLQFTFSVEIVRDIQANYCNFSGRASRSEFWWFMLFLFIVQVCLNCLTLIVGSTVGSILSGLVGLLLLLPDLGVMARRLHDVGRSAWWLLLMLTGIGTIVLIVWWCMDSTPGANEYGDQPNMVTR